MRNYSATFIRVNWISLVLVFLVVFAGSFVRITGSGMGCPDWPKCFGKLIPPTDISELPGNYKDIYAKKRGEKIEKFSKFLTRLGLGDVAEKIKADKTILVEQSFNARKTWTEYINRLAGFLAGNSMLLITLWILFKYRKRKLVVLSIANLIFLGFEAWFGSIVVATNLVPWTITVHLFFALLIIAIQLFIIQEISPKQQRPLFLSGKIRLVLWLCFGITFIQMFLGTQVRESIDELVKQGLTRAQWIDQLGMPFYIHRSFSWLVLILLAYLAYDNYKSSNYLLIKSAVIILIVELATGILLAYANMPGLVQTSHLIFASVLFGVLGMGILRMKPLAQ